jgi:phospholipid transport system substrate-binding protein
VATSRILDPETQEKPEERFNAIRLMVHEIVDFPEAARLSLGPNWSVRTPAERDEFVPLFADLLERSLIAGIAARIRLPDGVKVSYLGESIDGVMATVWTTIASRSGLDLPFKYQMIQRRDQWAVRDVMIDGVSVAANYRAQFTRVMQLSSYAELVRTIRARVLRPPMPRVLVTTVVNDPPVVRVLPTLPALEVMRMEPAETTTRELVAKTSESPREQVADGGCSTPCGQPDTIQAVLVQLARADSTRSPDRDSSFREEPPPPAVAASPTASVPDRRPVTASRLPGGSSASGRSYWVQIGAFKNPDSAHRLASAFLDQRPPVATRCTLIVEPASTGGLVRVRIGPFADRSQALSKFREIQARGFQAFIAEERSERPHPVPCAVG